MIPPIIRGLPIVDSKGMPTEIFWNWLNLVTDLQPILGTGSPDGVVEAKQGKIYFDTSTNNEYLKELDQIGGNRTLGWGLVT